MAPTSDPRTPNDHRGHLVGPAPVLQWIGLFLAPAIFALHLQGAYLLVLADCGRAGGAGFVHAAGVLATVIAAIGTWAGWATWLRAGGRTPGDEGTPAARTRLLGATGGAFSAVLTLILLAQTVAGFIVPRCQ